jgi:hypothetical protein
MERGRNYFILDLLSDFMPPDFMPVVLDFMPLLAMRGFVRQ